jgi:hypothetical protein
MVIDLLLLRNLEIALAALHLFALWKSSLAEELVAYLVLRECAVVVFRFLVV